MHKQDKLPAIDIYYGCRAESPLGKLWLGVSDRGLWALDFGIPAQDFLLRIQQRGRVRPVEDESKTAGVLDQLQEYLLGGLAAVEFPIDWRGMTDFQVRVRRAVMDISPGQTASYGQIAAIVGRPGAARAVGRVNATNPIPLVIPCHRVVGTDGRLTGYGGAGGIQTKQWLLELEQSHYFSPRRINP
jgi:methylated-DNA-[protein]-cysteine S-methyltransferase